MRTVFASLTLTLVVQPLYPSQLVCGSLQTILEIRLVGVYTVPIACPSSSGFCLETPLLITRIKVSCDDESLPLILS